MTTTLEIRTGVETQVARRTSVRKVGAAFLGALGERDFSRLRAQLADDVRMRALLPTGLLELEDGDAVIERLRRWFGGVTELTLLSGTAEPFADVLHVAYQLLLDEHPFRPGSGPQLVEHQLFCSVEDGLIASLDLLCSGFREEEAE
jgi:hypothetical protein